MKRLITILFLFLMAIASNAQNSTWPYILTSAALTCSPQYCSSSQTIPPGWYGQVQVFAADGCFSGVRVGVQPYISDWNCSATTLLYAYAYVAGYPNAYVINGNVIYAQQITGESGILRLVNGQYIQVGHAQQWSDCYTGALRQYYPPPGIC